MNALFSAAKRGDVSFIARRIYEIDRESIVTPDVVRNRPTLCMFNSHMQNRCVGPPTVLLSVWGVARLRSDALPHP